MDVFSRIKKVRISILYLREDGVISRASIRYQYKYYTLLLINRVQNVAAAVVVTPTSDRLLFLSSFDHPVPPYLPVCPHLTTPCEALPTQATFNGSCLAPAGGVASRSLAKTAMLTLWRAAFNEALEKPFPRCCSAQ